MSDNTNGTPVPTPIPVQTALAMFQPGPLGFYCSIPSDTLENKFRRVMMREGDAEEAAKVLNTEIVIQNLMLHEVTVTREDGEQVDLLRCVMGLEDGRNVGTCSTGIIGALQTMVQELGAPPWLPGHRFKVYQKNLKGNRHTYKLLPIMVEVNVKGKKP